MTLTQRDVTVDRKISWLDAEAPLNRWEAGMWSGALAAAHAEYKYHGAADGSAPALALRDMGFNSPRFHMTRHVNKQSIGIRCYGSMAASKAAGPSSTLGIPARPVGL